MIPVTDLVAALRGQVEMVAEVVGSVDEVVVQESARERIGGPGDLILGIGLDSPKRALTAIERLADRGVPAVVIRAPLAYAVALADAARSRGVSLIALSPNASWAHLIHQLRDLLDRAATGDPRTTGDDLYALADAAAGLIDASVTIEDAHHRVLAYSSRSAGTDAARVSTIVGRRVPPAVVHELRARGVFRRMTTSAEPFFLPAGATPDLGARFVLPVRAGGEWLGSIWCAVSAPPEARVVADLVTMASAVALHLLDLRVQSDLTRRVWLDRVRQALLDPGAEAGAWLAAGPWRVVVLLGSPTAATDFGGGEPDNSSAPPSIGGAASVDVWTAALRRRGWAQPAVVDIADRVFAIVTDTERPSSARRSPRTASRLRPSRPGTWAWLQAEVTELHAQGGTAAIVAGTRAEVVGNLTRSRAEAVETAQLPSVKGTTIAAAEDHWAPLVVSRAVRGLVAEPIPSPLAALEGDPATEASDRHTLSAWLDHPGSPRRAAEALGVHVNTIRYRMDRIAPLLVVDLTDPEIRLALQLTLRAG